MDIERPYIIMFIVTTLANMILLLRNRRSIRNGNVIWGSILFVIVVCNYLYISSNHYGVFPFDLLDGTITLIVFLFALLLPFMGFAVSQRTRGMIIYLVTHTLILTMPSIYFGSIGSDMFIFLIGGIIMQPIFIGIILFDFVGLTLINIGVAINSD